MANDPVFVRSLTVAEGQQIQRLLRRGRDPVARRRAEIVLCSEQGDTAGEIAKRLHFTAWYVRQVIHAFNERGLTSLAAQYENGGRPPKVLPEHESELIDLALTPPNLTGMPFTHWSLKTLRDEAVRRRLVPSVSIETVRQVLKKHRVTLQRTKTWKESNDPQFEEKKTPSSGSTRRRKPGGKP
jgi:transposase